MVRKLFGARFATTFMSMGLLSCSGGHGDRQEESAAARQYSARDKQIAQSLSLGSRSLLDSAQTPYDRAVLCKVSVDSVAPQLSAMLDSRQTATVDAARKVIDQRLRATAFAASKTNDDVARDINKQRENIEAGVAARFAIACLRDLA